MFNDGMKYVSFEGVYSEELILFPNTTEHSVFVQRFGIRREDILGAGFVTLSEGTPLKCRGKSVSLGVVSRPEDTEILLRQLGEGG